MNSIVVLVYYITCILKMRILSYRNIRVRMIHINLEHALNYNPSSPKKKLQLEKLLTFRSNDYHNIYGIILNI